jgi:hypothetical protein
MGFQTEGDPPQHTLENQRKVTAKLSALGVPYMGIGKNIRGHRRGVLVDIDALSKAMMQLAVDRGERKAKAAQARKGKGAKQARAPRS